MDLTQPDMFQSWGSVGQPAPWCVLCYALRHRGKSNLNIFTACMCLILSRSKSPGIHSNDDLPLSSEIKMLVGPEHLTHLLTPNRIGNAQKAFYLWEFEDGVKVVRG